MSFALLARSEEVEAALKLRFEVFNLELGGALPHPFLLGATVMN